jgi:nucleoside-diphosphate-sugar epimerase
MFVIHVGAIEEQHVKMHIEIDRTSYFAAHCPEIEAGAPVHGDFRPEEICHSLGDISLIADCLGYRPTPSVREALSITLDWYLENGALSDSLLANRSEHDASLHSFCQT